MDEDARATQVSLLAILDRIEALLGDVREKVIGDDDAGKVSNGED